MPPGPKLQAYAARRAAVPGPNGLLCLPCAQATPGAGRLLYLLFVAADCAAAVLAWLLVTAALAPWVWSVLCSLCLSAPAACAGSDVLAWLPHGAPAGAGWL